MSDAVDQTPDLQMQALAGLLKHGLRAALGADIVQSVYDHPVTLGEAGQHGLPSLSLYVGSSALEHAYSDAYRERVVVVMDYVIDATALEQRQRWQALRGVWKRIAYLVQAGRSQADAPGINVLQAAGFCSPHDGKRSAKFSIVERVYPYFRAEVEFDAYPERADVSLLGRYLEHHSTYDLPGTSFVPGDQDMTNQATADATAPTYGYDLTLLPAYGS